MREVMCTALRQLQLELPLGEVSPPGSAFFRYGQDPTPFSVPSSEEYLRKLNACWRDPRTLSRLSTDIRVLAAMQESVKAGLDRMPMVEPAVASLIVSPEDALRQVTDDLISRRQVWQPQSPMTEACHRTLRGVPVMPGELFRSAALEANCSGTPD
ncbi:hypothetical protein GOODEAATRI_017631 [Goodea atripinnis]|uniref:Uncharacterized protein n=1 Tax=Goodea atripinnis TaxID=208336 RepID=A0ABV0PEX0_9TELE